jgi:hypothetical protein
MHGKNVRQKSRQAFESHNVKLGHFVVQGEKSISGRFGRIKKRK